jgi:RNA polymerase sigma-70 factor (ECF subfamily)
MQLLRSDEVQSDTLNADVTANAHFLDMGGLDTPAQTDEGLLDFELMARIGAGEHEAFRQLIERHQDAVIGTVAKMLGNPSDAQDIAQQVFLRLWRNAERYRPDAKFTTYLFTITRNLVFNESRRRKRKKELSADEREAHSHHLIAECPDRQPDAQLLQSELQQAVDTAIASLPEIQRMAVILRRYEQLSYEEIATTLRLSVSAVKSLLFRARTSLREALCGYLEG